MSFRVRKPKLYPKALQQRRRIAKDEILSEAVALCSEADRLRPGKERGKLVREIEAKNIEYQAEDQ